MIARAFLACLAVASLLSPQAALAKSARELSFRSSFEVSGEPLPTEKVWELDPAEWNPHRQRWTLERKVSLNALGTEKVADASGQAAFRLNAGEVVSRTILHMRGEGPWFRPMEEFPCGAKPPVRHEDPNAVFATAEGSRIAAGVSAELWENRLKDGRVRLSIQLERLTASSPERVIERARKLFQRWLDDMDREWRAQALSQSRAVEWKHYAQAAAEAGQCGKKAKASPAELPRWENIMEPLPPQNPRRFLTRAPARRWDGLFSVRATVDAGDKRLVGQFLVDSRAERSVMSPVWLNAQGVNPDLLKIPGAPVTRVSWSGGGGLGPVVEVSRVEISAQHIPLTEFVLADTDMLGPPEHASVCCDGILGADFLRQFAVEFLPQRPFEIRLWDRAGFRMPEDFEWIEVSQQLDGEILSDCVLENGTRFGAPARWDTGSLEALELSTPLKGKERTLKCGNVTVAEDVPLSLARQKGKNSAVNVGMALLARGPFVFDLSHGRLWFQRKALGQPIWTNRSGLILGFDEDAGDRVLRVLKLQPGTPAHQLAKVGLKQNSIVLELDGLPVAELDAWEVEQRLSGAFGDTITVQWKTAQGRKLVPFKIH